MTIDRGEIHSRREPDTAAQQIEVYALWDFAPLVRTLGADPERIACGCGIDLRDLEKPGASLEYATYCNLLEEAARATGVEHFGLLLARGHGLEVVGWLVQLLQPGDPLYKWLRVFLRYFNVISRGELLHLRSWPDGFALERTPIHASCAFSRQAQDATLMESVQACRALLGEDWEPLAVHLTHRPRDPAPYSEAFKCPVYFDQPVQAVVIREADLDSVVPQGGAHAAARAPVVDIDPVARRWRKSVADAVRGAIQLQLAQGQVGIAAVAAQLNLHPRTLHRKLRAEGTTFQAVLDDIRRELALHFASETALSIAEIADLLGYGDPTAFTRAFRRWFRQCPSTLRATRAAGE